MQGCFLPFGVAAGDPIDACRKTSSTYLAAVIDASHPHQSSQGLIGDPNPLFHRRDNKNSHGCRAETADIPAGPNHNRLQRLVPNPNPFALLKSVPGFPVARASEPRMDAFRAQLAGPNPACSRKVIIAIFD